MGIFQRKKTPTRPPLLQNLSSAISNIASSSSTSIPKSKKKKSGSSFIRKLSKGDRSTSGQSLVPIQIIDKKTSKWEKRTIKRVQRFKDEHPVAIKLAGMLFVAAGASAATIPAVLAALGIKLAVIGASAGIFAGTTKLAAFFGGSAVLAGATTTTTTVTSSALAATGAKLVIGGVAMDVSGRAITAAKQTMGNSASSLCGSETNPRTNSTSDMHIAEDRLAVI